MVLAKITGLTQGGKSIVFYIVDEDEDNLIIRAKNCKLNNTNLPKIQRITKIEVIGNEKDNNLFIWNI